MNMYIQVLISISIFGCVFMYWTCLFLFFFGSGPPKVKVEISTSANLTMAAASW